MSILMKSSYLKDTLKALLKISNQQQNDLCDVIFEIHEAIGVAAADRSDDDSKEGLDGDERIIEMFYENDSNHDEINTISNDIIKILNNF